MDIRSFLTDRTQQVTYNGSLSAVQWVLLGVPQGRYWGPLLYVLYTAELCHIVMRHQLKLHQYADDCQVYITVPVDAADVQAAVESLAPLIRLLHTALYKTVLID